MNAVAAKAARVLDEAVSADAPVSAYGGLTMDEDVDRGDLGQIWQRARARLKASVGDDAFNSWFQRLEMEEILDDVAHLSVPTKFLCSWIESKYVERILACIREEDSTVTRLHLTVRINGQARPRLHPQGEASEDIAPPPPPRIMPVPQQSPRLDALSGSALDPRLTFETFVPGKANEIALGVAKQVASAAMRKTVTFNPVYIHSTVGLGKSHLLNAVAWAAGKADPGLNIVYLTADHFMYHFISAVQRQSAIAFKEWLRRIDLLLIDDMQFLQGKSATEFGHNLSALLSGAKQVVVAGDAPPRDLDMIDERVRSRLSGGLVVPIVTFDFDLRRAIVARRAEMAVQRFPGVHFPGPVIDFIAHAVVSHGRDLDGAVNRLVAANQLTNEAITVQLAERTLADLMRIREVRRVRIEDILKLVSKHFKVPRNDLLSSRRSREVVRPRQIAMYLAKSLTSRSLPEIGRRFGGRDHTTVLHSVRKVEQMMKDDSDLQQEIELLKKMLEE